MNFDLNPLRVLNERLEGLARSSVEWAPNLIAAFVFLLIVLITRAVLLSIARRLLGRSRFRKALQSALLSILSVGIVIAGVLITATILLPGLTPSELFAGLGIGSLAVGLAFRDTFENFLAGLLILLRKSMRIGDFIVCDGVEGKVEEISLRDTHVRGADGVLTLVPNSYIFKNPTEILTDIGERRVSIIVGVAYGADVDQARSVITDAVKPLKSVSKGRPLEVFAQEFGASSIDFEVTWWTQSSPGDLRRSRDEVVSAVKRALDSAGIEIPFPYRTLTFKDPLRIQGEAMEKNDQRDAA